jgi:hypothetical protein
MKLIEKKYYAERGTKAETYQSFTATIEADGDRNYLTVELGNLQRWRSPAEYASYMRWVADEIEKIPIPSTKIELKPITHKDIKKMFRKKIRFKPCSDPND